MTGSVRDFYKSKHIFLTGATGFLGSFVVEKLLRTFKDVGKIYLLIRPKNGQNSEQRKRNYFKDKLFSRMKIENPTYFNRVVFVEGDLSKRNLNLSQHNLELLKQKTNIVLHIGANIKLKYPLRGMINENLKSTRDILEISKDMQNFQSFVYVSTLFSNCRMSSSKIDEKIYPHPVDPEELIKMHDEYSNDEISEKTSKLLMDWPNTYTYVKNATENLCLKYKKTIPIGIYRPGLINPSYEEPIPYYDQSSAGIINIIKNMQQKNIKTFKMTDNVYTHSIPVDHAANALLAIAYNVARVKHNNIPIYNFSSANNKLSYVDAISYALNYNPIDFSKVLSNSQWIINAKNHSNDTGLETIENNKKNEAVAKFVKIMEGYASSKVEMANDNIELLFEKLSPEDKELLPFDTKVINWKNFFENYGKMSSYI